MTNTELIDYSGKAIQDRPNIEELAQDFAAIRCWRRSKDRITSGNIFDRTGEYKIADNYSRLAKLMESCNGFIETATGAIQIHPYFNALSNELAMAKLIVESSSTSK